MTTILKTAQEDIKVKTTRIDPKEFFQTREGLYVWGGFNEVSASAGKLWKAAPISLNSFDMTENASDREIENAIQGDHLWDPTHLCATLAALIEAQPKGEEGPLLTNGYANLFYTSALVVRVGWDADRGKWFVSTWRRDDDRWDRGRRVFALNNCHLGAQDETLGNSDTVSLPELLVINEVKYKRV